jgi:hypothetical protein
MHELEKIAVALHAGRRLQDLMFRLGSCQVDYCFVAIPSGGRIITEMMTSAMRQAYGHFEDVEFMVIPAGRHEVHTCAHQQDVGALNER